jgi:hypothetical protein
MPERVKLTHRQRIVLAFLNPLMEAYVRDIGEHVVSHNLRGGSNKVAVGAAVCARLRKMGLVTYLPDTYGWRITPAGRAAIEGKKDRG